MKNLKNQKGITLVALVVTIIVLLILAGVSLSLVAGSDGILSRATRAVDENLKATVEERVNMKLAEYVEDYYEEKYVNRSIDNATEAIQFISGETKKTDDQGNETAAYCDTTFNVGTAEYVLDWGATDAEKGKPLTVKYTDGKTYLEFGASVSKDGVMTDWKLTKNGNKTVTN